MIDVYTAVSAHGHGLQLKSLGPRRRRAQIAEYLWQRFWPTVWRSRADNPVRGVFSQGVSSEFLPAGC
jgi:hypothetical protein